MNNKKRLLWGIPRVFEALCQELGTEIKHFVLLYLQLPVLVFFRITPEHVKSSTSRILALQVIANNRSGQTYKFAFLTCSQVMLMPVVYGSYLEKS